MGVTDLIRPWHIILILIVAVLMFGPGKLAGLGKSLGEGLKGFKDAAGGNTDTKNQVQTEVKPMATTNPVETSEIKAEELAEFKKYQALKANASEES
jgi:sec-independent protein translocase protein TatA